MYTYHFFIHSSVDGHVACFHVLAIVNSVVVPAWVHVSFSILVFKPILIKVGLRDHTVALFLPFKATSIMFSIAAVTNYIPAAPQEGHLFLTLTLALIACSL